MRDPDRSFVARHARADALARHDDSSGGQWVVHAALLDRLAAMRRDAEASGWTSLAVERDGPAERFRLFGVPPGGTLRTLVPDEPVRSAAEYAGGS